MSDDKTCVNVRGVGILDLTIENSLLKLIEIGEDSRDILSRISQSQNEIINLIGSDTEPSLRQRYYDEVRTSTSTDYISEDVYDFLSQNAENIFVINDGPGAIYVKYSNDGIHYSNEFIMYENEIKNYINAHDLKIKTPNTGVSYRVTEFEMWKTTTRESQKEEQVFTTYTITDINPHSSSIFNASGYTILSIFVKNNLDQQISVQVKSNRTNSVTGAKTVGTAFDVAASGNEARTIVPENDGWLPYYFITVTAAVIPTSGSVDTYIIGTN